MHRTTAILLALALAAGTANANAQPGLGAEEEINNGLFVISVANRIRKDCGDIAPRLLRAHRMMTRLRDEARARGYSDAEIDAYVSDETEKDRMDQRRDTYIRASGAEPKDGPSMCALGRAEIDRQSLIGNLLRIK